ncbi:MAG TPA: FkbM family methyltransferase [Candidatus Polarisedimenticolia bacterium]|nr:FkbM family methyltransferase [Candidatus Polarisedimenticolia bacterium]
MKTLLRSALERVAPRFLWRHRISSWRADTGEAEEVLLPWICDRHKISIDVGAADGNYTMRMLLYSSRVIAFEPRPEDAQHLQHLFRNTRIVSVEQVALSNDGGRTVLRRPTDRPMLSTIEAKNELAESASADAVSVNRIPLDQYKFQPVGFIKIDVEGHEPSVLAGAKQTIERERPTLLIEIEQSHNPSSFDCICASLKSMEYIGCFLLGEELLDIRSFDFGVHQCRHNLIHGKRSGTYINNFLFIPRERLGCFDGCASPKLRLQVPHAELLSL